MKDFFVSYTSADISWAEWIAWELEAAGYSTIIQAWDFRPGQNFVIDMQKAASEAARTVIVLSEAYLKSAFTQSEWAAAFAQDPTGQEGRIVPVCVGACQPGGVLRAIIYINLVGLDEPAARERLLEGVQAGRSKPDAPPLFPGGGSGEGPRPAFPGQVGGEDATPGPPTPMGPPPPLLGRRALIRGSVAYVATTGLILLASWTGLFSAVGADDWLERRFLAHMQRYLPPPAMNDVVLLRGRDDGGPLGAPGIGWRGAHAEILDALSRAGARVIAFDLHFDEPSPADDEKLVDAIRRASSRNTGVVLGVSGFDAPGGKVRPTLSSGLAAAGVRWGTLWGDATSRRIAVGQRVPGAESARHWIQSESVPVVPSLALAAVMQYDAGPSHPVAAVLRPREDVIEIRVTAGAPLRTIPVDGHLNMIVDVAGAIPAHSYQQIYAQRDVPASLSDFAGKVVVIGYETPDEAWTTAAGATRYKMEVQASAIAQMLRGRFLERLPPGRQYLVILLMGALGALLRLSPAARRSRRFRIPSLGMPLEVPVALVVAVLAYAFLAFVACKALSTIPRLTYDLAALVLTYAAVGWATRWPLGTRASRAGIGAPIRPQRVA